MRTWPGFLLLCMMTACAPRFRADLVASGSVAAPRPGAPPSEAVLPVAEAGVPHRIAYTLVLPHAMEVTWTLTCPGVATSGVLGEPWARYRERRLAELERQRREKAKLAGDVIGAVVPGVEASAGAKAPGAEAEVTAAVDPGAVAATAVYSAQGDPQLPPGDTGARVLTGEIDVSVAAAGQCTVTLAPVLAEEDVSGLRMDVRLLKIVDVREEKRAAQAAANQAGLGVRVEVVASLTALGADPQKLAREQAAAEEKRRKEQAARDEERRKKEQQRAAARAEAERKYREQQAAKARVAQVGLELRVDVVGSLVALGADPYKQAREQAARDEERRKKEEARLQARAEKQRKRRERQEAEWRAQQAGLAVRKQVIGVCLGLGADPEAQARRDAEALAAWEAEQKRKRDAQLAAEAELRAEAEAALGVRANVKLGLYAAGAVDRPPRPAPPIESPPPPPSQTAVWISGEWSWSGSAWVWIEGHYEQPPTDASVWVPPVRVEIGGSVSVEPGKWIEVRDHRKQKGKK